MTIQFLDVNAAYRELQQEIDSSVARVLSSGQYIGGTEVEAFEEEFANYCGVQHAIGVGNGLDALSIALRSLDIGKGDEVIVPTNTYIATWLAVTLVGARVVPVEPDPVHFTITAEVCSQALTSRTKAIIPVHLYGQPANLDPIIALGRLHDIAIVEDAAQAHGSRYNGRKIGSLSELTCWSFYPGKNLGALGDAGAVTTCNSDLAKKVRMITNYGSQKKYVHEICGVNSRLDPLQAAILRVKLPYLDEWNLRRVNIAEVYAEALTETHLELPVAPVWADPVWHQYVVRSPVRDQLAAHLRADGVQTLIHYPIPPHRQAAYAGLRMKKGTFPIAEALAGRVLSLPIGPHLPEMHALHVIDSLNSFESSTRNSEHGRSNTSCNYPTI